MAFTWTEIPREFRYDPTLLFCIRELTLMLAQLDGKRQKIMISCGRGRVRINLGNANLDVRSSVNIRVEVEEFMGSDSSAL